MMADALIAIHFAPMVAYFQCDSLLVLVYRLNNPDSMLCTIYQIEEKKMFQRIIKNYQQFT